MSHHNRHLSFSAIHNIHPITLLICISVLLFIIAYLVTSLVLLFLMPAKGQAIKAPVRAARSRFSSLTVRSARILMKRHGFV